LFNIIILTQTDYHYICTQSVRIGRTIVGYMYMTGITKNNMGLASTIGITLLAMVIAVKMLQLVAMVFFMEEDA